MKTYRQKSRASQQGVPAPATTVQTKGPDEEKIKKILERTGYTLDVTTGNIVFIRLLHQSTERFSKFLFCFFHTSPFPRTPPLVTSINAKQKVKENMVVRRRIGKVTHRAMDAKCFVAKYQKTCSKMNLYRCLKSAVLYGI